MKYSLLFLFAVIGYCAAAGHYIPRAYYFIDENGNPSQAQSIHRLKRQAQQPFGNFGFQFPNFAPIQPGAPGTQFTGISTSQTVQNRFGEDPVVTGQTQTFHSTGNKYQSTNTRFGADGKPQTQQTSGRVRRQHDLSDTVTDKDVNKQVQSQEKPDGTRQLQTQSGEGPQFQQQAQPGATQTQLQGDLPVGNVQGQGQRLVEPVPQQAGPGPQQGGPGPQQGGPIPQQGGQQHPQGGPIPQQGGPGPQQGGQQYQQGGQQHPQGGQYPQGGQQHPQGGQYPQGGQQYPQGGQQYPQGGQQYPQGGQGFFPGQFPAFGFMPQPGFGNFGFGNPGFGNPGFAAFGFPGFPSQGFAPQGGSQQGAGILGNRFGEDDGTVIAGQTSTITSQNGQFHATHTQLKPDGTTHTTHQSGKV